MKKDRIRKMHEKRAENRRLKKNASLIPEAIPDQEGILSEPGSTSLLNKRLSNESSVLIGVCEQSVSSAPRIIIENGKPVLDTSSMFQLDKVGNTELLLVENKKSKRITSMSFKTRNYTEKWTAEETTKFFKVLVVS